MSLTSSLRERLSGDRALSHVARAFYRLATFRNPRFGAMLRALRRDGMVFQQHELDACSLLPAGLLDIIMQQVTPRSVLDVGCGTGASLAWFLGRGVHGVGLEGSTLAIAASPVASKIRQADLREPIDLGERFDLVWSYEVAEHLHPQHAGVFVDTLVAHGDCIVMSAARPGQGGERHFNEQEPEYWIEKFARRGFVVDEQLQSQLRASGDQFAGNIIAVRSAARRT